MSSLSVIIPAFNEGESLQAFLPEAISFCRDRDYRLIVVDDGSVDGTRQVLESFAGEPLLTVIRHKVNRGYGGAIKSAIRAATTDHVITIDADGQHHLEDIERLHSMILESEADMVVGNRDANPENLYRRTGKTLIRHIARLLMSLQVVDINSGMKICDTALAKKYNKFCPDSMAYSDTITLMFIGRKHLVLETPISLRPRMRGESTISTRTAVTTCLEILNVVVLFHPMRIFLPLSALLIAGGVVWDVPIFLRGEGVSVGAMLLIVSGLLCFLLGLITEMLSNIRQEQIDS